MTEQTQRAPETGSPGETRRAEVYAAIDRAAAGLSRDLSEQHGGIRAALISLRTRLGHAHDMCDKADYTAWGNYVVRLDRGLAELQIELSNAAERPVATPTLDDVLFTRTNCLELDGWLIRLDIQTKGRQQDASTVRALAQAASQELSTFGTACRITAGPSRDGVEQAMAELRRAARPDTSA